MTLREFLRKFNSFGTNITDLVIKKNGKNVYSTRIGDERGIKPEYLETNVKGFTFPKSTQVLYVILENTESESYDNLNLIKRRK